ncbi:SMI1/KNR4 family protein [Streptomyces sp. NPDC005859]|uniref:SMI1/KNR4 family protein n=1 Tax=Streptomyces sp. NPDC005859 TaxID=3157170 RepID=UPI0033F8EC74
MTEALYGGIPDRQRAWAFIRSFAGAWGDPLTKDDGTPEAELAQAEAILGCRLPTALQEFYALAGARPDLVANQDPLLPPHEMFVHAECGGVLVFRSENQGCAFWGVRLADLDRDDPPVLVQARHGWVPFLDRVSLACIELVLSEALFGGGGRLYNACELPADLLDAVPEHFQRVQLPDYPMWTGPEEFPVRWFSAPGMLLRQDGAGVHSRLHGSGEAPR